MQLCVKNWFESSISLRALCETRGIAYLHVLQPTFHDRGSKPLSPEEQALPPGPPAWKPAVVAGYPRLRERAKDLEAQGVHYLDESQAFADTHETLYFDACHFGTAGNLLLARRIAPYFLEHMLSPGAGAPARVAAPPGSVEVR